MKKDLYTQLHDISKTTHLLNSIEGLLGWDQETYMPHGAISFRTQQLELIASLVHKAKTAPKFAKVLNHLIDIKTGEVFDDTLSSAQLSALREWRRDYNKAIRLSNSFVKTFAKTTSSAIHSWSYAKRQNDFSQFAPHLEKIVHLVRKKADYLSYQEHPYDALLDLYEPEMRVSQLIPLFAKLKISLTSLIQAIAARPPKIQDFLQGYFPPPKQSHFAHLLLKAMGFEDKSSRLDYSSHPFCSGFHPKDTRMTTRIHPDAPMSNIFAVLHEGGHGLYNMGLPEAHFGSPLGEQVSLGIDESQSRFWETFIGHSFPFWKHFYPLLQETFPENFKVIHLDDFYQAINTVTPSLIRIEADEVTYSLHIIVRFEIEKALIEGNLKIKEIPEAWNEKMREYLGITPSSNAEGCLQDIHWSMGNFGYFPTYTLGNLYAAQFFEAFEKAHPSWKERVERGELGFIRNWLHDEIHQYGRQFTPPELMMRITGKAISEEPYIRYLEKKFKGLYHI